MAEFHLPPPYSNFTGELAGFQVKDGVVEVSETDAPKARLILERYYSAEGEKIDPEEWAARHDEDSEYDDAGDDEIDPALPGDTTKPVSGSEDVADDDDTAAPVRETTLASPEDLASMTRTELADRAKQYNIDVTGLTKKQIIEKLEEHGFHGRINS
jgi:hypothetical protein